MNKKRIILLSSSKSEESPNQFFSILYDSLDNNLVSRLYLFKKRRNIFFKIFFSPIDILRLILNIYNLKPNYIFTLGFSSDLISALIPFKSFVNVSFIRGHLPNLYSLNSKFYLIGNLKGIIHYYICSLSNEVVCMTGSMSLEFFSITKKKSLILGNVCKPIYESLIDLKNYKNEKKRNNKSYNFIMVGSLKKSKNILKAIYSFSLVIKKYKNFKLNIYGDGELMDEARGLSVKLGCINNIFFHGHNLDKKYIYKNADFLFHPSFSEGTSRSVLEALCLHIPVIMLPIPGAYELIKNDFNGLIIKDLEQLIFQIPRLTIIHKNMSQSQEGIDYFLPQENKLIHFKSYLQNLMYQLDKKYI